MNSSNYRFTLDMQSNQSQVSLPVRLNDTNRKLYIILTNGGTPFIMERGSSAVLTALKPDGNELVNQCEIENNSVIRYDFTEQTANVAGVVDCEIRLYDPNGELVTSPRFILVVDERVIYDNEILSKYEGTALDYILGSESARQFAEADRLEAEEARLNAESARGEAETTRKNNEKQREADEVARANAETTRMGNEGVRIDNELARQSAEIEREKAADTMMAVFNTITGNNAVVNLNSINALPNYIVNNVEKLSAGDVLIIANNEFDFIYMGLATDEEKAEAEADGRYYTTSDFMFGVTWEAGNLYVVTGVSDNYHKLLATTEKYKLPVGHEELAQVKNETSNAIKGKATGEVVCVNDVSPIEHTVKCRVRGKNLIPYPYVDTTKTHHGITYTDNGDGSITIQGTATGNSYFVLTNSLILGKPIYSILTESATNGEYVISKRLNYNDLNTTLSINVNPGTTVNETLYPQLELGTIATEYVPYVNPTSVKVTRYGTDETDNLETYIPSSDGTVAGIKSLAPTMTLLTDTANVVVEVEYNKDINIINKQLTEALSAILEIQKTLIGGTSR